jgi:hypothetical protein
MITVLSVVRKELMMSELNIYQRINAVMKEVEYVQKDGAISGGGANYKAVTHDQVTSVVRKSMVTHGIVIQVDQLKSEMLIKRDVEAGVKMHLYSGVYAISFVNIDDGNDRLTATINAHANDNGDKAPGKAASYAVKYAMLKTFTLETGENDESRSFEEPDFTPEQKERFDEILESRVALDFITFSKMVGNGVMIGLSGSFEKGKISQGKHLCKELEREGWDTLKDYAAQITVLIDSHDPSVTELVDELSNEEKRMLAGLLNEHQIKHLAKMKEL